MKICRGCGIEKPLSEFGKHSIEKDGLRRDCRACRSIETGKYRKAHREEILERKKAYRLANAKELSAKQSVYYAEHRVEYIAYHAAYRAANLERKRAQNRAYEAAHKDKAYARIKAWKKTEKGRASCIASAHNRRHSGGIRLTRKLIDTVKADYGGICPYCNETITDGHIDHVVPVSGGGTNDPENLAYSCAPCNMLKGNKSLLGFILHRMGA